MLGAQTQERNGIMFKTCMAFRNTKHLILAWCRVSRRSYINIRINQCYRNSTWLYSQYTTRYPTVVLTRVCSFVAFGLCLLFLLCFFSCVLSGLRFSCTMSCAYCCCYRYMQEVGLMKLTGKRALCFYGRVLHRLCHNSTSCLLQNRPRNEWYFVYRIY